MVDLTKKKTLAEYETGSLADGDTVVTYRSTNAVGEKVFRGDIVAGTAASIADGTSTALKMYSDKALKDSVNTGAIPIGTDTEIETGTDTTAKLYAPDQLNSAIDSLIETAVPDGTEAQIIAGTDTTERKFTPADINGAVKDIAVAQYAGRTEMKAITGLTAGDVVYLSEGGRSGTFETLPAGDYSAEIAADPLEGVYVLLDDGQTLKRRLNGYVTPEMFGAILDGTDMFEETNAAILIATSLDYELKFSSTGELAIATQSTTANDTYGSITKYAFYIGAGKSLKISATDGVTIKNLTENSNQHIFFLENADSISISGGIILDANATTQNYTGSIYCAGVNEISLDMRVINSGPVRIGSSLTRLSGRIKKHNITYENGVGTFSIGGKPGGVEYIDNLSATLNNCRGGVNIEAEDADEIGLTHIIKKAEITYVMGDNMDGGLSPMELVKVEDGAKVVHINSISLNNGRSASTGRACAISVKSGQGGNSSESVVVDYISSTDALQCIWVEADGTLSNIGSVDVKGVYIDNTRNLLVCRNTVGSAVLPVSKISISNVTAALVRDPTSASSGTLISIDSSPESPLDNALPPHVDIIKISDVTAEQVQERAFDIRGVKRFIAKDFIVSEFLSSSPSGDYSGSIYNVIEADHIVLDRVTLMGFAGSNLPIELRPKISCRVIDTDILAGAVLAVLSLSTALVL